MKLIQSLFIFILCAIECSAQSVSGQVGSRDYVDLGLKSGTKWATYNVGATKTTEVGDFFAWGETKPKEDYSWANYKWCENKKVSRYADPQDFNKYVTSKEWGKVDNKKVLVATDDAATVNWGNAWRTPTYAEITELVNGCVWQSTTNYKGSGVDGQLGTSKTNGNTIFLPGYVTRTASSMGLAGYSGYYWSSSLDNEDSGFAHAINFSQFGINCGGCFYRFDGRCVRAVVK